MDDIRAFTVGDARYFLGVVALLNSLRLTGNAMPLTVLDIGLEGWQRSLLEGHCDLVEGRPGIRAYLLKADAPLASDADVALILDSDIIVTGSLSPMVDSAREGLVSTYGDQAAEWRWFAEWTELFDLRAPLRHEMYVNSGAIAVSTSRMPWFLPRWSELCEAMVDRPVMDQSALAEDDPLWLADQEALNALLLSEVPSDQVVRHAFPGMVIGSAAMAQVVVEDLDGLRCSWQGDPVTVLHAVGLIKPWQRRASRELRRTAYAACLRRALSGAGLEVEVPTERLPAWLRAGAPSALIARALHAYDLGARTTRPLRRRVGLSSGRPPKPD